VKIRGIFMKVFVYTTVFLILLVCVTLTLFSQQFMSFYRVNQIQRVSSSYQRLVDQFQGENVDDFPKLAQQFFESNQSFQFYIEDREKTIIYHTPNADTSGNISGNFTVMVNLNANYTLRAHSDNAFTTDYEGLISQVLIALIVMLAVSIAGALIFARQMTRPIKQIADNTRRMAELEDVPPTRERADELGDLSRDVHSMYDKLKETISKLEDEILRVRELEENQRYFFSAASHELKTPIAATSVLLEGMLENIGDYKDHPKYLKECVKLMDAQTRMIYEILEIVSLNDGKINPTPEKIDVGRMVADVLPNFYTLAEANEQRIVCNIPEGETTLADSKLLKRALANVLLNAVQNTPEAGEIRIWTEAVADGRRLYILNTGAEIDDAALPKLFDPFYRVDKARSRKDGRSGLGLTIVQKALEAMEIDFSLENAKDGVMFWMDLSSGRNGNVCIDQRDEKPCAE